MAALAPVGLHSSDAVYHEMPDKAFSVRIQTLLTKESAPELGELQALHTEIIKHLKERESDAARRATTLTHYAGSYGASLKGAIGAALFLEQLLSFAHVGLSPDMSVDSLTGIIAGETVLSVAALGINLPFYQENIRAGLVALSWVAPKNAEEERLQKTYKEMGWGRWIGNLFLGLGFAATQVGITALSPSFLISALDSLLPMVIPGVGPVMLSLGLIVGLSNFLIGFGKSDHVIDAFKDIFKDFDKTKAFDLFLAAVGASPYILGGGLLLGKFKGFDTLSRGGQESLIWIIGALCSTAQIGLNFDELEKFRKQEPGFQRGWYAVSFVPALFSAIFTFNLFTQRYGEGDAIKGVAGILTAFNVVMITLTKGRPTQEKYSKMNCSNALCNIFCLEPSPETLRILDEVGNALTALQTASEKDTSSASEQVITAINNLLPFLDGWADNPAKQAEFATFLQGIYNPPDTVVGVAPLPPIAVAESAVTPADTATPLLAAVAPAPTPSVVTVFSSAGATAPHLEPAMVTSRLVSIFKEPPKTALATLEMV